MNIYIMQMEAIESRIPKEVSGEEYYAKLNRHSKLKFTEEECEFFRKFTESNKVNTKLHNAYYHRSNHLTDITTLKGNKISNFRQKYDIKPFGITVNDINNIHDEKRKKYLSKFYDKYKDLSDQKLEEMLLDRIKYEINDKIRSSIRLGDNHEEDYPLFKFIKDNKNNIVKRLEKAGYKVEHYKMDDESGGWETITIHWKRT